MLVKMAKKEKQPKPKTIKVEKRPSTPSDFPIVYMIFGIIVIVAFLILAFNIFPFLGLTDHTEECSLIQGCPHEQQLDFLEVAVPIMISVALIIGAGTYYLMSQKVESQKVSLKKQL